VSVSIQKCQYLYRSQYLYGSVSIYKEVSVSIQKCQSGRVSTSAGPGVQMKWGIKAWRTRSQTNVKMCQIAEHITRGCGPIEEPAACHLGSQCMNSRAPGPVHNSDSRGALAAGCPHPPPPGHMHSFIRLLTFGKRFRSNRYPTAWFAEGLLMKHTEECRLLGCYVVWLL
jgi:hypothetical protein